MRANRASYIAGFGTTGVLVASALLLLAVVSTLVAFRGWPGTDAGEDIGNLVVGEGGRPLAVEGGPARIARAAAPAAGAVAETAAPGTPAAASAPAARAALPPTSAGPRLPMPPVEPSDPGGAGGQEAGGNRQPLPDPSPESSESLLPETPVSAGVRRVTSGLGDTTQGVTDGLGRTVGSLSPPLSETLVDAGRLLADLLRALGQLPR